MVPARTLARSIAALARRTEAAVAPSSSSIPQVQAMSKSASSYVDANGGSKPYTIVVEGNIGSGKTTFLEKFRDRSSYVEIFSEPVDKWRDVHGHNLLDMLYSDPARWSLLFQTYVQLTMLQQHSRATDKPVKLMERSLARYCFIENLYAQGKMADCEYAVISEWFNYLITCPNLDFHTDLIVYLRTKPEVAYERIQQRSRHEENKIPFQYIKDLHELHEDWLVGKTKFQPLPAPVMVIDANEDLSKLTPEYLRRKERILKMARESASG